VSTPTAEELVRAFLLAAGLSVSDEEFTEMVADYPAHRAALDALYAVPMVKEEEPQLVFSPVV
jgi:hypothetical protein